ncbi:hypothetical protein K432DRAFT_123818 [Lepidopterella palustris CBS 459.81]|uniref:Secreted protein n=1 Tax=Lepidopterella palustris CBS 459.81 TaxID=1314670 RepID=A0A8E2JCF8_9PEZI|nr:hypothetical protein K432DRAFT_123818 [Lepidopterella palustris CBS 459.81]
MLRPLLARILVIIRASPFVVFGFCSERVKVLDIRYPSAFVMEGPCAMGLSRYWIGLERLSVNSPRMLRINFSFTSCVRSTQAQSSQRKPAPPPQQMRFKADDTKS